MNTQSTAHKRSAHPDQPRVRGEQLLPGEIPWGNICPEFPANITKWMEENYNPRNESQQEEESSHPSIEIKGTYEDKKQLYIQLCSKREEIREECLMLFRELLKAKVDPKKPKNGAKFAIVQNSKKIQKVNSKAVKSFYRNRKRRNKKEKPVGESLPSSGNTTATKSTVVNDAANAINHEI